MVSREISLYLKYPGSHMALSRLQHSFMECVVEHKSGTLEELHICPPNYLKSDYYVKGTVVLEDDELVVTFTPKQSGLHTAKIFADTRELCKPVAFIVNQSGGIESTPIDKPLKESSSLFRHIAPSPAPSSVAQQSFSQYLQPQRASQAFGTAQRAVSSAGAPRQVPWGGETGSPIYSQQQQEQEQQQQQHLQHHHQQQQQQQQQQALDDSYFRGFTSDPALDPPDARQSMPLQDRSSQVGRGGFMHLQRFSHITGGGGSRPVSMMVQGRDEQGFPGDLHSMTPETTSFNQLYSKKTAGETSFKTRPDVLVMDHSKVVTPDTFEALSKDISQFVGSRGMKTRRRCSICSKKVKMSKLIYLGEHDFCETCFKRQYTVRSAVDHFLLPLVQECTVDVPINKKRTRFISTRKTIPDINLRGLEPSEVRFAQEEFKKFDMDNSGWISKAVLYPLLKACFSGHLREKEIKLLLSSISFKSLVSSYGIDGRDEVHELEFLSLLAFLAREAISSKHSNFSKAKKFSPNDLEMAYAFHSKFGTGHTPQQPPFQGPNFDGQQKHQSPPHQKHQSPPHPHYRVDTSPQHVLNMSGQHFQQPQPLQQGAHSSGHGQMGQSAFHAPHMPMRNYPGHGESLGEQQLQNRYEVPGHGASMLHQSARYSGQVLGPSGQQQTERDDQRMNMLLAANEHQQRGSHYSSPHGVTDDKKMMPMHLYPQERPPQVGGDMLDASRTSAFSQPLSMPAPAPGFQELPEEDQEEHLELPTLPPDKDPLKHTISLQKKQANSKRIMEDLKLTGAPGADSWMMY